MNDIRKTELIVIIGVPGCGKSTFSELLAKKHFSKRILTVTPHDNEWLDYPSCNTSESGFFKYQGIKRVQAHSDVLTEINKKGNYYRNGLLILDDAKFYVNAHISKDLEQIIISKRQRAIDIVVSAHGLTLVPKIFFNYITTYVMFKTSDNLSSRKKDLIFYNELEEMQAHVNENALENKYYHEIFTPL